MKKITLVVALFLVPLNSWASSEDLHLFLDLNGNGVSDLEENSSGPAPNPANGLDEIELAPTPEDLPQ